MLAKVGPVILCIDHPLAVQVVVGKVHHHHPIVGIGDWTVLWFVHLGCILFIFTTVQLEQFGCTLYNKTVQFEAIVNLIHLSRSQVPPA